MPPKNRLDGAAAVIEFMRRANLDVTTEQVQQARLIVSAKAGDKWRVNKEPLSVEFDGSTGVPDIAIPKIDKPFYRAYRHIPGTRFMYDIIKDRLFIEGNLNKGRGDPFVICLSR
ncbi:MAG: hypothetical protein KA735_04510 [Burkholderiaceae bacterium]|nr:hypothetical protein [Burkholderiaceae bacterium]